MYQCFFKPFLDLVGSLILLLLLSPVFLFVFILIYFNMGRPVFFTQVRPGKDEKLFTIYKFRTMENVPGMENENDQERLTALGRVLRRLSLDELPQLINILQGQMSFIGPRPLLVEYLGLYDEEQKQRHSVKPGISGWAQVNGRNAISWEQKFKYDVWYTKHISFILDARILLMTIKKVVMRKDISAHQHATSEKFNGHN